MAQTSMTREVRPDKDAYEPRRRADTDDAAPGRRLLPKILIGLAVLLVAIVGAGMFYAASIDRSLTQNLNRGVELPTEESSTRPRRGGQAPGGFVESLAP